MVAAIRRFHSLRSFHRRLFTFSPCGANKSRKSEIGSRKEWLPRCNASFRLRTSHFRILRFSPCGAGFVCAPIRRFRSLARSTGGYSRYAPSGLAKLELGVPSGLAPAGHWVFFVTFSCEKTVVNPPTNFRGAGRGCGKTPACWP